MNRIIKLFFLLFLIINTLNATITIGFDTQNSAYPDTTTKHQKIKLIKIKKISNKTDITCSGLKEFNKKNRLDK